MAGWKDTVNTVVEGVKNILDTNKATLGLAQVRIGEERKGWTSPSCFVYLGPGGVVKWTEGERTYTDLYRIPVRILVLTKKMTMSNDLELITLLENTADTIDANAPVAGCRKHEWPNPVQVTPTFVGPDGEYETIGMQDVEFQKLIERAR